MRIRLLKWFYYFINQLLKIGLSLRRRERLALVSAPPWQNFVLDDLRLQNHLLRKGFLTEIISWHQDLDYTKYRALVIASMWDYSDFLSEFYRWQKKVQSSGVRTINPLEIITKNCDKVSQHRFLTENGLPTVKTAVLQPSTKSPLAEIQKIAKGWQVDEVVLKPHISGGGKDTFLVSLDDLKAKETKIKAILKTKSLLVQPYQPEIKNGELALIYIGGKISHAVMRYPQTLRKGGLNRYVSLRSLSKAALELGNKVASLKNLKTASYLRLDLVQTKSGFLIMELELFEPQLYFYLLPCKIRKKALKSYVETLLRAIEEEV